MTVFLCRYIARHNAELAQAVVDAGAVPLLVLCIQVCLALLSAKCVCYKLDYMDVSVHVKIL